MIKNVLQDIGGVGVYGVISICLFFLVFTVALIRSLCVKRSYVETLSRLPLEDGTTDREAAGQGDLRHG
jgi:hypothetical protein